MFDFFIQRYGLRTENEDITNTIKDNLSLIDHSARKMQMVHSPCWKELSKGKWIDPVIKHLTFIY